VPAEASAQAAQGSAPAAAPAGVPLVDDVYKTVVLLKGLPIDTFFEAMGMFANSMGNDCTFCHASKAYFDKREFATPTPRLQRARQMIVMMNTINKQFFGGQQRVTCFTCHAGGNRPKTEPNLDLQYGEPVDDPYAMNFFPSLYAPSVDEVFAKYLKAMGGTEQLATFMSFSATGTYAGYETEQMEVPAEVYAQAPNRMATIARSSAGTSVKVFDGRTGWRLQPDTPMPLLPLTGGNLTGAAIEAMVWFPTGIQRAFSQWQIGVTAINDRDTVVAHGTNPGQPPVRLYFDESGRLVRLVHWTVTAVGAVPTKIDYSDFRTVAGIQMPFQWTRTWTNNQVVMQLKDVRPNVEIEPERFAKPEASAK
jgi:outer membrane lipoprotein-sorting protein